MEREIKFRAWDTLLQSMVVPDYITSDGAVHTLGEAVMPSLWQPHKVPHEVILMQFTGLLDKNKTPIFEGDIVNFAVKRKICPVCSQKEISSELTYLTTRFCPECGIKVADEDFVTTAKIVFHAGAFCFNYEAKEYGYHHMWNTYVAEIYIAWKEIIGNIHQHPHLLTP